MDEPETELRGPAATSCPACGGNPRGESLLDGEEERWLAICRCGRIRAFLPEQPALEPEGPLRAFLLGPGRPVFPPSPPWSRLFLASLDDPNRSGGATPTRPGCAASASFGVRACPRPNVFAACALCLVCGHVIAQYSKPADGTVEKPVVGSAWAPPCAVAQRLGECLYRPFSLLRVDGWRYGAWAELGEAA